MDASFPPTKPPAVRIGRAHLRLGKNFDIDLADITIPAGSTVAIIGANGAGKSTFIELLLGLRRDQQNDIELLGTPLTEFRRHPAARAAIGAHVRRSMLIPEMRIREVIGLHRAMYRTQEPKVAEALAISDLASQRYGQLSRGQRLRVHLFLACAHLPRLLLLDEPTTGLDASFKRAFLEMLRAQFLGGDRTVLFVSHQTDEVLLADDVIWMAGGRMRARGKLPAILACHAGELRVVVRFSSEVDMRRFEDGLASAEGIRARWVGQEFALTLLVEAALAPGLIDLANRSSLKFLSVSPADLSDLFRSSQLQ